MIYTSIHLAEADRFEAKVNANGRVAIWLGTDAALTFPPETDQAELVLLRLAHEIDRARDLIRPALEPAPGWEGAGASVEAQRG